MHYIKSDNWYRLDQIGLFHSSVYLAFSIEKRGLCLAWFVWLWEGDVVPRVWDPRDRPGGVRKPDDEEHLGQILSFGPHNGFREDTLQQADFFFQAFPILFFDKKYQGQCLIP